MALNKLAVSRIAYNTIMKRCMISVIIYLIVICLCWGKEYYLIILPEYRVISHFFRMEIKGKTITL